MRLGSLCSGYGGLEAGIGQVLDIEPVWCSEIDKDASTVLATHHPTVPNLGDLTVLDWHQVEPVDIICAGFPCQPFSHAGKRLGADDERAIFQYIADGLSVLRPGLVVLENVPGILTLGGVSVIGTLTGLGYDCRWGIVRASDTGAPHRRARWFCIASHTDGVARPATVAGDRRRGEMARPGTVERAVRSDGGAAADAGSERHGPRQDARRVGLLDRRDEAPPRQRQRARSEPGNRGGTTTADASDFGHERARDPRRRRIGSTNGNRYTPAIKRWEYILGRPAPAPTDDRGLRPEFVEWMMGLPEGWVCDLGLSRTAALKMLGNGVVPQQAALAVDLLL